MSAHTPGPVVEPLFRYEITVYEKSEHWTFSVIVEAASLEDALKIAKKDYRVGYVVRGGARAQ